MSDYKLVSVEPTQEMVEAAADAYMPFGDMELALRMAILAAPVVHGEPQPAEQQPCPEGIRECAPYDDPAFESLCREHEIWGTPAAAQCAVFWEAGKRVAEHQPAPDVAGLVEALEAAQKEAVRGIKDARTGAQVAAALGRVSEIVGAALAPYRKGGEA